MRFEQVELDRQRRNIVVVGASAGGGAALRAMCSTFSQDLRAAILIVRHVSSSSPRTFARMLSGVGPLTAAEAEDGEALRPGQIRVAPPDCHLLVDGDRLLLRRGPPENRARPAVDPLFRSAAASHDGRVIGVVLSGYLDDGASGLHAIKRCGGLAVVQSPNEAEVPEMPSNAMAQVEVDYVLPADRIGSLLNELTEQPAQRAVSIPEDIRIEAALAASQETTMANENRLGELSPFSCPDCGGNLWHIKDGKMSRYRCHVGHAFTENGLSVAQQDDVERALWTALRALRERTAMLERLGNNAGSQSAERFLSMAREYSREAETIQALLLQSTGSVTRAAE